VEVAVDESGTAELAIHGGRGYVPVTFRGLKSPREVELWRDDGDGRGPVRVDQSVHGHDFWQTDFDALARTWSVTFTLPLDTPDDRPRTVRVELRRRP
jgi:hypothetical protein